MTPVLRSRLAAAGGAVPVGAEHGGDAQARPPGSPGVASRRVRVGIFGAPLDTGNLGVSALGLATIEGLVRFAPDGVDCHLFDHGRGSRPLPCDAPARVTRVGAFYSRRFYRRECLPAALAAARCGLAGLHPLARDLRELDALLDVSGGDSFTDLYGDWRFRAVTAPKALALALGRPLVLLPQTYGPFTTGATRARARELLRSARHVWARDAHSLTVVRELLGPDFDPRRHREAVDVAFGLPARTPARGADVVRALAGGGGPILGLNVSGLLFHREEQARGQYGLATPYRTLAAALLRALLAEPGARVLLVPHVVPPCTPDENDVTACHALRDRLSPELAARVIVAPALSDPREAKWVIGQCDWFCGTRMHACIAALSQGVPTLGIAYSDKTAGVFETIAMGSFVVDARHAEPEALVRRVEESLAARRKTADGLAAAVPQVLARWEAQFRTLLLEITR